MPYCKLVVWWNENPSTGQLRHRAVAEPFGKPHVVHYCKYYTEAEGKQAHKPTALWTDCEFFTPRPLCTKGNRCNFMAGSRHAHTISKSTTVKAERLRIPQELCKAVEEASRKQVHANWMRDVRAANDDFD